ncbi:hypothetical protein N0V90_011227 [Kalmusia sp. IMI 367209]|nr:hypothetical protein N0V90_011227 [Kalmusia sp. IMI 367209]
MTALGIPASEHLLASYPEYTAIFTVRNASGSDKNTAQLRETIARFANAKATIHALDLSSLSDVYAFADQISSDITSAKLPPLDAIIANADYWNLVGDPEITSDGFDKTFQVAHIAHSVLVLSLLGRFGEKGRIVLLSSDSHWPGRNSMEKYPPVIRPDNLDELIKPFVMRTSEAVATRATRDDKRIHRGVFELSNHMQDPSLSKISAVAINPGNLVDSRALTSNTPIPMGRTLRTAGPAGIDVIELAVNPEYADKMGFFTLLQEDTSSPASQDESKQEALWKKTLEWAKITAESTALNIGA